MSGSLTTKIQLCLFNKIFYEEHKENMRRTKLKVHIRNLIDIIPKQDPVIFVH